MTATFSSIPLTTQSISGVYTVVVVVAVSVRKTATKRRLPGMTPRQHAATMQWIAVKRHNAIRVVTCVVVVVVVVLSSVERN